MSSIERTDSCVVCKDGTFHYEHMLRDVKTLKAALNSGRGPEGAVHCPFMSDELICVRGIASATAVAVCNLTEHNGCICHLSVTFAITAP